MHSTAKSTNSNSACVALVKGKGYESDHQKEEKASQRQVKGKQTEETIL